MGKLKKLTEKFFKPKLEKAGGNGLYATLEELTEQRRFVPYLKNRQFNHIVSSRAGDVKSAFKGRGMELEEIRSYAFGDDVRDIDWRVTAGGRRLIPSCLPKRKTVKSMSCSTSRHIWFLGRG